MSVKLLIEHHFEFLSLKGDCRCSSESTHVKMLHCWKSHALAQQCATVQLYKGPAPLFCRKHKIHEKYSFISTKFDFAQTICLCS